MVRPATVRIECLSEIVLCSPAGSMKERSQAEQDAASGEGQQRRLSRRRRPPSAEETSERHKFQKSGYDFELDTSFDESERLCLLCCEPIKVTHKDKRGCDHQDVSSAHAIHQRVLKSSVHAGVCHRQVQPQPRLCRLCRAYVPALQEF